VLLCFVPKRAFSDSAAHGADAADAVS